MSRFCPQPNKYRTFPLPADDREAPLDFKEIPIRIFQGSAKRAQLGERIQPFMEFSASDESLITQVRYKQGTGEWTVITQGEYPTLGKAVQAVNFTPEEFGDYIFYLEITAGGFLTDPPREVDISATVEAGKNKTAQAWAPVKPFFDSRFSIDSDLLSSVKYAVNGGESQNIPATFGTDLIERVKNFSLCFSTSGEKEVSLIVTDSALNEASDSLIVKVGS